MDINWFSIFLGWLGGIPSGILAQWLFNRYLRGRKRKGMYLTTTISTDAIEFEGRVWHDIAMVAKMQEIERQVLGISAPPTGDQDTER
jgi:hypothetical protein